MKLLLFLVAIFVCAPWAFADDWQNALRPKGAPASSRTLVRDGQPLYAITLPATPTGPERKAADDLRQWVKQMTGAELPLAVSPSAPRSIRISTNAAAPSEQYTIAVDGDA